MASSRKIRMRGALDGVEAMNFGGDSNPLVKFHGCLVRSPEDTLWTKEQLRDAKIAAGEGLFRVDKAHVLGRIF